MLPPPLSTAGRGGRPEQHHRRAVLDAIRYVCDNGAKWRALPADFPPWSTVYSFFATWSKDGIWAWLTDKLRAAARLATGRDRRPSAGIIDSQSVAQSAEGVVGKGSSGFDPHKKVNGRKRHIIVDVLGFLICVAVGPANRQDRDIAPLLLPKAAKRGIHHLWADSAYLSDDLADCARRLGITLDVVKRPHSGNGFHVLPRRWAVERTLAWLTRRRRNARDYERLPRTHAAWVHIAASFTTIRRIATTTTRSA
jgi:putative transposase